MRDKEKQKFCTKCLQWLDLNSFSKNKHSKDLLNYRCKSCNKKYEKERKSLTFKKRDLFNEPKHLRRNRAIKTTNDNSITKSKIDELLQKTSACLYCGRILNNLDRKVIDHMQPLSKGGAHIISNIIVCCHECNTKKRNLIFDKWLLYINIEQIKPLISYLLHRNI